MLNVNYSSKFKKDFKACVKCGLKMALLQQAIDILRIPEELSPEYKNYTLINNYKGYSECHIQPDWLLIYKYVNDELYLARTGTHSDLF